jgi:hypothetical protein
VPSDRARRPSEAKTRRSPLDICRDSLDPDQLTTEFFETIVIESEAELDTAIGDARPRARAKVVANGGKRVNFDRVLQKVLWRLVTEGASKKGDVDGRRAAAGGIQSKLRTSAS